jgi:hypothetical protein
MSSGRNCEGYQKAPPYNGPGSRNIVTIYMPGVRTSLVPFAGGSSEIDFYRRNIASTLSGHFDSDFWFVLIMQLAQSEPAIRHAIGAITIVHQDTVAASLNSSHGRIPLNPAALQQSSAAMRCLGTLISAEQNSYLVPLVACLLFTCLEFLRGSVDSAMAHMKSGFKMLNAFQRYHSGTLMATPFELSDARAVDQHVVPVFQRLSLLCLLFGHHLSPLRSALPDIRSPLSDLMDARRRLFDIMSDSISFITEVGPRTDSFHIQDGDLIRKTELEIKLQEWHTSLEQLLNGKHKESYDQDAISLLRIHHRVVLILLSVSLKSSEVSLDAHNADFRDIVNMATSVTYRKERGPSEPKLERFSFEMKIIPPLFYTAIKCRVPSVRRAAIDLLRLAPRREGLWDARIATRVAETVVEIEENGLLGVDYGPDGFPDRAVSADGIPPESARIHNVKELPGEFRNPDQIAIASPTDGDIGGSDSISLTFCWKPSGLVGPMYTFTKEVEL